MQLLTLVILRILFNHISYETEFIIQVFIQRFQKRTAILPKRIISRIEINAPAERLEKTLTK